MVDQMLIEKQQQDLLVEGLVYADRFINKQYLTNLDVHSVLPINDDYRTIRLFRIEKLVFDSEENTNDKLISVYGALNSIHSTVFLVIRGMPDGVNIYIGTRCEQASTASNILREAIYGNFAGSKLYNLDNSAIQRTFADTLERTRTGHCKSVSSVTLVPSLRDDEKVHFVQGLEKLIDSMAGRSYTTVLIAEPLDARTIAEKKRGLEELYATISPFAETSLAYGNNASHAVADGTFSSFSESINNSVTNSNSESQSHSTTTGESYSSNFSASSDDGFSVGGGSTDSYSETYGTSTSWSRAVCRGQTKTDSSGVQQTITNTIGESRTLTIKHTNKSVSDLMEHIDRQLERIRECESFGLWSCAAYFVSEDVQTSVIGASTFRALLAGDNTQMDRVYINTWDGVNSKSAPDVLRAIAHACHPIIHLPRANQYDEQSVKPTVLVSGKELPLFVCLPQRSVPGMVVDHMASFGRAVFNPDMNVNSAKLSLGCVLHKGVEQPVDVQLDVEEFRSHCFITGSTGSGKSNTTYGLLQSFIAMKIPFLVVEPAKGEYKFAFGALQNINIFWTNPATYRLLRLNPFSFPEGIHVLEHMDRLIEIFNACWPLYSAMPAILKASVERAYVKCGWDLLQSKRVRDVGKVFPTFEDLLSELPRVIKESSYSADTKGDYTGALVTRVSSLTNGIMGSIFCTDNEISDTVLFDQNTIVDLSRVGASETKSLIMGILVMKLNEHRMSRSDGMNLPLRHVTVLEEAHNLLRRTSTAQSAESSNVAGKSVEMISNSIAEMRTYGEGFIIVDQSPTAVDISAIKNTNTKIVMRLPECSDFETVGNSFALSEEQIREIARLRRGAAIVSQNGWLEPVMVSIHRAGDMYDVPMKPVNLEIVDDGTIEAVLHLVAQQTLNNFFNERQVRKLLDKSILSLNQREVIMSQYARLCVQSQKENGIERVDRAMFSINVLGCKSLAEIYPLDTRKDDPNLSQKNYTKWKQTISNALDNYARFTDQALKERIASDLVVYMARVEHRPSYITALELLRKN